MQISQFILYYPRPSQLFHMCLGNALQFTWVLGHSINLLLSPVSEVFASAPYRLHLQILWYRYYINVLIYNYVTRTSCTENTSSDFGSSNFSGVNTASYWLWNEIILAFSWPPWIQYNSTGLYQFVRHRAPFKLAKKTVTYIKAGKRHDKAKQGEQKVNFVAHSSSWVWDVACNFQTESSIWTSHNTPKIPSGVIFVLTISPYNLHSKHQTNPPNII